MERTSKDFWKAIERDLKEVKSDLIFDKICPIVDAAIFRMRLFYIFATA